MYPSAMKVSYEGVKGSYEIKNKLGYIGLWFILFFIDRRSPN